MKRLSNLSRFALPVLALSILAIGPTMIDADNGPNHRVRNLNFGVSGGNVNDSSRRFCCSGTLGALLTDNLGTQYILSNNHVMGLSGSAVAGQDISQPGLIDSNCQVSTVVADFTVAPALSSNVDAAIAQLRPGLMNGTGAIEDIGAISSVVRAPTVGLAVQKSGRTTGHTTGTISSINATISVRYSKSCGSNNGPVFTFTNQVVINSSTFSAGGDSGSLIVSNTGNCSQPVALLFAGSSTTTIGNPISQVLTQVGLSLGRPVTFVGGTCTAAATSAATLEGLSLARGLSDDTIARVSAIKDRREHDLFSRPGVMGVGVGTVEDNPLEAVIIVYVDMTSGFSPRLPRRIEGVRVKAVYTDPFVAY
ncbi:MAG TPA: hypothetical protein VKA70_13240 [Blastocatellia bacterium]|nr:hypothetical protein [Blastocatellia bacterium]